MKKQYVDPMHEIAQVLRPTRTIKGALSIEIIPPAAAETSTSNFDALLALLDGVGADADAGTFDPADADEVERLAAAYIAERGLAVDLAPLVEGLRTALVAKDAPRVHAALGKITDALLAAIDGKSGGGSSSAKARAVARKATSANNGTTRRTGAIRLD